MTSARAHVLRYGRSATSYQTLNPGIVHAWIGDALVGFVRVRAWPGGPAVRVVAGVPIGPPAATGPAVRAFEEQARAVNDRVLWFGVEPADTHLFRQHTGMVIGEQPVWEPSAWPTILERQASLRAQVNRAQNKGVEVEEWRTERAATHSQLRRCLAEWSASRGLPALTFLTDPFVLYALGDRRVVVAQRDGVVVAYLLLAPVRARRGWLVEWIIRGRNAPNGTAAVLLDAAFRRMADEGAQWATLGLVALSSSAPPSAVAPPLAVRATLRWVRAHARRFYNFEGLERFKAKFRPTAWEPIRVYSTAPAITLSTLYTVADAFAGTRSPPLLVAEAIGRAVRDEARFAARAARRRLSSTRGS